MKLCAMNTLLFVISGE